MLNNNEKSLLDKFIFRNKQSRKFKEIYIKHSNDEHHDEFDQTGINEKIIENMVKHKYIPYDHNIDQKNWKKKWNKDNKIKLSLIEDLKLPKYLVENKTNYSNWFD